MFLLAKAFNALVDESRKKLPGMCLLTVRRAIHLMLCWIKTDASTHLY